jgi:hypothetical protein
MMIQVFYHCVSAYLLAIDKIYSFGNIFTQRERERLDSNPQPWDDVTSVLMLLVIDKKSTLCQFFSCPENNIHKFYYKKTVIKIMSVAQYLLEKDQLKYFSPFEKDFKMRLFHPANILIVSRDLWIILLSKI